MIIILGLVIIFYCYKYIGFAIVYRILLVVFVVNVVILIKIVC